MKNLLCALATVFLCTYYVSSQVPATPKEASFKDWNYSPTGVFGLIKLDNPEQRPYYKIFRPDLSSAKIQEYDSAGIVVSTTVVRFVKGKLNQMISTNRWGDAYQISKFTVTGPNEFMVTVKNLGKNSFLPCKGARYIYHMNQLAEIRYVSYDGKPCSNGSGVAIIRYKRYVDKNRFSLLQEQAFFDGKGEPVISSSSDCHKIVYEYSERGNQNLVAYYGTDDEPLTNRFGGFKIRSQYDENDSMLKSEVIGINDELVNNAFGVSVSRYEYRNGLLSNATRFDDKDRIVKASAAGDGVAKVKYDYDDRGNEVRRSFFDEDGNPMNSTSGHHRIDYAYSPNGMLIAKAYFDKAGFAAVDNYQVHRYVYDRDDKGRIIQEAFFDKDNNPMKNDLDAVFMAKFKYDEYGRESSRSYWQNGTTKMPRWDGYHEQISRYNDDGQVVEALYYDENGKLYVGTSGYSRRVQIYDSNARLSERKLFNDQTPASVTNSFVSGYHSIKFVYDNSGRVSSVAYFDTQGKPVNAHIDLETNGLLYHKIEFLYMGNRVVEEKFYAANSDTPSKIIDCLKNDHVSITGINRGRKNL